MVDKCADCDHEIPRMETVCTHCGRPSRFPNVLDASEDSERQALDQRYERAIQEADARGCGSLVRAFESAVAGSSAVIARPVSEVERLAASDSQLYATYYGLIQGNVKVPTGEKWDALRGVADHALFGKGKDQIRFAALTLDGVGLSNYGDCSLVLRDNMIAHRASVMEENSVKFMERHDVGFSGAHNLPKGFRAPWDKRSRLSIAKLASDIKMTTKPADFPRLLLSQGPSSDDDEFVEVQIWGPMTIRTFEHVVVSRKRNHPRKAILSALKDRLDKYAVPLQVN